MADAEAPAKPSTYSMEGAIVSNRIIALTALIAGLVVQSPGLTQGKSAPPILYNLSIQFPGEVMLQIDGGPSSGNYSHYYVTAVNGGDQYPNALISSATAPSAQGRFLMQKLFDGHVRFETPTGYYVSALSGGGYPAPNAADSMETSEITPLDDALFTLSSPYKYSSGLQYWPAAFGYEIKTYDGDYLKAVNNGGRTFGAFYTSENALEAGSAPTPFNLQHCGDLGSGYVYNINAWYPTNSFLYYDPIFAVNGGGVSTEAAFTSWMVGGAANSPIADANFKFIKQADGSYALQTGDGVHYVTATNGGGIEHGTTALPNLVSNRTAVGAWETFRFADQGNCIFTIQAVDGNFLAYSRAGFSTDVSGSLPAVEAFGYTPYFILTPVL